MCVGSVIGGAGLARAAECPRCPLPRETGTDQKVREGGESPAPRRHGQTRRRAAPWEMGPGWRPTQSPYPPVQLMCIVNPSARKPPPLCKPRRGLGTRPRRAVHAQERPTPRPEDSAPCRPLLPLPCHARGVCPRPSGRAGAAGGWGLADCECRIPAARVLPLGHAPEEDRPPSAAQPLKRHHHRVRPFLLRF